MSGKYFRKANYAALAALSGLLLMVAPTDSMASHYHDFPDDPNSPLERDFGFVTTITGEGVHGSPSPTEEKDIDQIRSLDESFSSGTLKVGTTDSPVGATGFLDALTDGMDEWEAYSTYTDQPEWTVLEDNLDVNLPSLFTDCGGFGGADGDFEAAFCSRGLDDPIAEVEYSPSFAVMAADGGQDTFDEADIAFNLDIDLDGDGNTDSWTQTLLDNVARHEIGHLYGLGDLYGLYESNIICNINESSFGNGESGTDGRGPVMCDDDNPVSIGDANGLFYLYPNSESISISEDFAGAAGDLAIADLDGDSDDTEPEFVVVEIDEDSSTSPDTQHFILRPFSDINENTYSESSGVQEELFTRETGQIFDVGLSIENIGQGSRPELILSWVESGEDSFYIVYWDIFLSSGNLNWADESDIFQIDNTDLEGLDTVFMDMGGDSDKEMVVISTNQEGTSVDVIIGYRYVELNPTTGAPMSSWTEDLDTGIVVDDEGIGAGIIDEGDRLVAVAYHAEGLDSPEYAGYKVLKFDTDGTLEMSSARQLTTLEQTDDDGSPDSYGADAYLWTNVGANFDARIPDQYEYKDLVVMTFDDGIIEFTVERDTRYNAHGTDDNEGRQ